MTAPTVARGFRGRARNFGPGPAYLPDTVVARLADDFVNFGGSGLGLAEVSHRGPLFRPVVEGLEERLRRLLALPERYAILWLHGGATPHFGLVPLNLARRHGRADYVLSGHWSERAWEEARRFVPARVVARASAPPVTVPPVTEWALDPEADYVYYTDNESVDGVEFPTPPRTERPLVADMTANFLSRPVDVRPHVLLYAGVQKNLGVTGLGVVVVDREALPDDIPGVPRTDVYAVHLAAGSMLNTPNTLAWYTALLMLEWIESQGGLEALALRNRRKAERLYAVLDRSGGFYRNEVAPAYRSRMNVPFTLAEPALLPHFFREAADAGLHQLEGHRSRGGVRASLYNAQPEEAVAELCGFLEEFQRRHG